MNAKEFLNIESCCATSSLNTSSRGLILAAEIARVVNESAELSESQMALVRDAIFRTDESIDVLDIYEMDMFVIRVATFINSCH